MKSLYDGLSEVDEELWKDIISLQKNWIGECNGARFDFKLKVVIVFKFKYLMEIFAKCSSRNYFKLINYKMTSLTSKVE